MEYRMNALIGRGLALSLTLFSSAAFAQNNPELGDVQYQGGQPASATVTTTTTTTNGPFAQEVAVTGTDHAAVVGHLGVGYFGIPDLPYALDPMPDPGNRTDVARLPAPTIGARYWLDERMAIEGAIGIGFQTGSVTQKMGMVSTEFSGVSLFGLALHAGLPLVFATTNHFAFELIPELNFGFVSGGQDGDPDDLEISGVLLQLGARIGAEIQFGFIGIPQLALQGTVGLALTYQGASATLGNTSNSISRMIFETSVQNSPWDIFRGGVAAIYYL